MSKSETKGPDSEDLRRKAHEYLNRPLSPESSAMMGGAQTVGDGLVEITTLLFQLRLRGETPNNEEKKATRPAILDMEADITSLNRGGNPDPARKEVSKAVMDLVSIHHQALTSGGPTGENE